MNEEFNEADYSTEETETSAPAYGDENNTQDVSEDAQTRETGKPGRTAQDRIQQLIREKKALEAQLHGRADNSSAPQSTQDNLRIATIEARQIAPEHLREKASDIAAYHVKHGLPMEDVITLFDAKNKLSKTDLDAARKADQEAAASRTGGNANPASRNENSDPKSASTAELEAQLKSELAAGAKI